MEDKNVMNVEEGVNEGWGARAVNTVKEIRAEECAEEWMIANEGEIYENDVVKE